MRWFQLGLMALELVLLAIAVNGYQHVIAGASADATTPAGRWLSFYQTLGTIATGLAGICAVVLGVISLNTPATLTDTTLSLAGAAIGIGGMIWIWQHYPYKKLR